MSEETKKRLEIQGRYYSDAAGYLYHVEPMKNGEGWTETAIANFTPELVELTRRDNGFEVTDTVRFRAFRNGQYEPTVEIQKSDILSNHPDQRFGMGCRVFIGRQYAQRLAEVMQMQCEDAEIKTIYAQTGFRDINGEKVYLNGDNSVTKDGITSAFSVELDPDLARCYRFLDSSVAEADCYPVLLDLMEKIAPDWVIVPCLAYCFMSPLSSMLREKGAEPSFSFYIVGRTGSYKSSLAKVLLSFFGKISYAEPAPLSFLDTQNAIGRKLALISDMPVLLDDRRPTSCADDKNRYEGTEKFVSSAIGDRASRGRLNADSTGKTSYVARSNVFITAEEAYNNIGSSAIARSISVELQPNTIDFAKLCVLQDHTEHLNKLMQLFVQWLIINYDAVSAGVDCRLKAFREKFASAGHPRLATAFANLSLGYRVLLDFLVEKGALVAADADQRMDDAISIFLKMCSKQSDKVENEKPTKLFIKLLNELIETKQVRINDINTSTTTMGDVINPCEAGEKTIGYRDREKGLYYLIPSIAYTAVYQHYAKSGYTFPASMSALWKAFADEKLSMTDTGRTDKRRSIKKKSSRYIALLATAIENDEEGGE